MKRYSNRILREIGTLVHHPLREFSQQPLRAIEIAQLKCNKMVENFQASQEDILCHHPPSTKIVIIS